jgi:hypothetical protein
MQNDGLGYCVNLEKMREENKTGKTKERREEGERGREEGRKGGGRGRRK